MNRHFLFVFCCVVLMAIGCDIYSQDDYEEYYVVESYLVANRQLPSVRVTHTLPVDVEYTQENAAVRNAQVEIHLLNADDSIDEVYTYSHKKDGVYQTANTGIVRPERRYELKVTFPQNNDEITARTLVPGSFNAVGEIQDTAVYQSTDQIEITTTLSEYPGRQAYYIFTVNVLNPSRERLTPFYEEQIKENNEQMTNLYVNSSGIINEQNYELNEDNTLTLRLPWLSVAFYGFNDITANAIDDNIYDFLRSQSVQGGGSTLPPGEIQNIEYNVQGGIGVFGSLASDTVRVFIQRPATEQ